MHDHLLSVHRATALKRIIPDPSLHQRDRLEESAEVQIPVLVKASINMNSGMLLEIVPFVCQAEILSAELPIFHKTYRGASTMIPRY